MNGKIRIELGGKEIKLWFNRYTEFEMKNLFKGEDLMKAIEKRVAENELSFMADLIWIGVVGHREATLEDTQISRKEIRGALAEVSIDDWGAISKCFFEAMGAGLEKPKKKAGKAKKRPQTKTS